ncbi:MFS transporter [Pseudovibrio denitrificans]|uniref:MFS transporter n=1 Tax=Pseudovibrio denitrificans TaxID=258256 RepID=UPI0039BF49DF
MQVTFIMYYITVILTSTTRGAMIVGLSWLAYQEASALYLVGVVFLTSHVSTIFIGPFIGATIDSFNRRLLVQISQILVAIAFFLPLLFPHVDGVFLLPVVAFISNFGPLVMQGSLDGIQQVLTPEKKIRKVTTVAGGLRQIGMVSGGAIVGLIIASFGETSALFFLIFTSLLSVITTTFLPVAKPTLEGLTSSFISKISEGVHEFSRDTRLLRIGLVFAAAFSIGQATNVLLPALVSEGLDADSLAFGIIDAAWSVGGIAAAFILSKFAVQRGYKSFEYLFTILLGTSAIVAGTLYSIPTAIALYLLMGAFFSVARISCDSKLLEICPNTSIGRVRTHFQTLVSIFGVVLYGTTATFEEIGYIYWFAIWGAIALTIAILVWLSEIPESRKSRSI